MKRYSSQRVQLSVPISCVAAVDSAVILTSSNLLFVWPHDSMEPQEPIELPITPVTLCSSQSILFAASNEGLLILAVDSEGDNGDNVSPVLVIWSSIAPFDAPLFPLVAHSSFNHDATMVAICSQSQVFLLPQASDGVWGCDSEFPLQSIECSTFFGHNSAVLTTFGASRLYVASKNNHLVSFSVDQSCAEESSREYLLIADAKIVTSAHSISQMCVDELNSHLFVSITDGTVRIMHSHTLAAVFTVAVGKFVLDLYRQMERIQDHTACDSETESDFSRSLLSDESLTVSVVDMIVCSPTELLLSTTVGMISMSRHSFVLGDSLLSRYSSPANMSHISNSKSSSSRMGCVTWLPFENVSLLDTFVAQFAEIEKMMEERSQELIHGSRPLPLSLSQPLDIAKAQAVDAKSVTFGRPIKSSGYSSTQPWSVQQAQKAKAKSKLKASTTKQPAEIPRKQFNVDCPAPVDPLAKSNTILASNKLHAAVVTSICFDGSGTLLISASGDATLHLAKLPVAANNGSGICARGHKSMIHAVDATLAMKNPVIASCSFDGVIGLWRPTQRETPYLLKNVGKEVKCLKFGCMDKILAFASGSALSFARYSLDDGGGDLDRKRNDSAIDVPVTEVTASQQINAFAHLNYVFSTLFVWCGSNKQIGIYDLAAETSVRLIDDAHTRPIHSVEMMQSSRFADLSSDALHCFCTASVDKTVRLWDVRQEKPTRQFSQHVNSALRVGLALSPCGRFVAVGSEDRSALLYCLRTGAVFAKLSTPDVVTSLRFHSVENLLAVGCSNGDVKLFGAK